MKVIQKKYKGRSDQASREAMSRETMALYKKHGTNPMSSCLPLLAQSPIFFALYQVLRGLTKIAAGAQSPIGPIGLWAPAAILVSPLSTWYSAKKIGDCASNGRQDDIGFVPCFLYSAIVSRLIASRDAWSLFPLYFFWITFISVS